MSKLVFLILVLSSWVGISSSCNSGFFNKCIVIWGFANCACFPCPACPNGTIVITPCSGGSSIDVLCSQVNTTLKVSTMSSTLSSTLSSTVSTTLTSTVSTTATVTMTTTLTSTMTTQSLMSSTLSTTFSTTMTSSATSFSSTTFTTTLTSTKTSTFTITPTSTFTTTLTSTFTSTLTTTPTSTLTSTLTTTPTLTVSTTPTSTSTSTQTSTFTSTATSTHTTTSTSTLSLQASSSAGVPTAVLLPLYCLAAICLIVLVCVVVYRRITRKARKEKVVDVTIMSYNPTNEHIYDEIKDPVIYEQPVKQLYLDVDGIEAYDDVRMVLENGHYQA